MNVTKRPQNPNDYELTPRRREDILAVVDGHNQSIPIAYRITLLPIDHRVIELIFEHLRKNKITGRYFEQWFQAKFQGDTVHFAKEMIKEIKKDVIARPLKAWH